MLCKIFKILSVAFAALSTTGDAAICATVCKPVKQTNKCKSLCEECRGKNVRACTTQKLKEEHNKEVKDGADKGEEAKSNCMSLEDPAAKRRCIAQIVSQLPKPSVSDSAENRTRITKNLLQFQEIVDEAETKKKRERMKAGLFNQIKNNANNATLERLKREMCGDTCINGTQPSPSRGSKVDQRYLQKICIQKCVRKTLEDVESADTDACYANATTDEAKALCFCPSSGDDEVRRRISKAAFASRVKGVTDFLCKTYTTCTAADEVDCKDTLRSLLKMAKKKCSSGKQKFRASFKQVKTECEKKQIYQARKQCTDALGAKPTPREVRQCISDATGMKKGRIKKMAKQNLKKQFHEDMIACKKCRDESAESGSTEDCPDTSMCTNITKEALREELGSDCEGNFKALVENGLEEAEADAIAEDEEVDVAMTACEFTFVFKKGRGECRPDGELRPDLKSRLANDAAKFDGVAGLVDGEVSTQIEREEESQMVQEATFIMNVTDENSTANMTDEEKQNMLEEKCENLAARLQNQVGRRLGQLQVSDISEVTASQASKTCAASNASCNTELSSDPASDPNSDSSFSDTTTMGGAEIGDARMIDSTVAVFLAMISVITDALV